MTPQQVVRAVRLYQAGRTLPEIAEDLGYQPSASRYVWRCIRDRVQVRRTGPRGRQDVPDEVILQLRDDGLSWQQVAEETGMSKTGVQIRYRHAQGWRRDPVTRVWIPPPRGKRRR